MDIIIAFKLNYDEATEKKIEKKRTNELVISCERNESNFTLKIRNKKGALGYNKGTFH